MTELPPLDPVWPRYSTRPFPSYRYVPGKSPHPRRNLQGHSFGLPEPKLPAFPPEEWHTSEDYRYGIDLYNFAYWWECHEIFEALWHAVGPKTEQGNFFQALIQIAAGNLKQSAGARPSAERLWLRGLARLKQLPPVYMGMNVAGFAEEVAGYLTGSSDRPASVRLQIKS
jgi:predicted metal-dependent hydrolase